MAYVIAEPCIGTKDTACVDVCPVDCIHPRKDEAEHEGVKQLFINPVGPAGKPSFGPPVASLTFRAHTLSCS